MCCYVKLKTHRSAAFIVEKMVNMKLLSLCGIGNNFCIQDQEFELCVTNGSMVFETGFTLEVERVWQHHRTKELQQTTIQTPSAKKKQRSPAVSSSSSRRMPKANSISSSVSMEGKMAKGAKRPFSESAMDERNVSFAEKHKPSSRGGGGGGSSDNDGTDDGEGDLLAALDELDKGEDNTADDTASCSREKLETMVRGLQKLYRKGMKKLEKAEERAARAEKRMRVAESSTACMEEKLGLATEHLLRLVSDIGGVKSPSMTVHNFRDANMVYNNYKGMAAADQPSSEGKHCHSKEGNGKGGKLGAPVVEQQSSKYMNGMYLVTKNMSNGAR